jgi:hypothetical protein
LTVKTTTAGRKTSGFFVILLVVKISTWSFATLMVSVRILRELHRFHIQLTDLRERLDRGPKQIKAHEANVARCESELVQTKADAKALRVGTDQKQLLLKSGESKIKELKNKLNVASTNREYQVLKDQIAADEMANSVLADEILEALERMDVFDQVIAEAEQKVARCSDELVKVRQLVHHQQGLITGDLSRLELQLRQCEQTLPDDFRDAYQRVVKSKGSDAMAQVEGENCGGCFQVITPNMMSDLFMGHVVGCNSCGRLLYIPEDRTPGRPG